MYRTMILSVLGEDETGIMVIFENNIDNLRDLTMEIRNAIRTQEHASEYLKFKCSCSNIIKFMISSFRNIKLALDINLKNRSDDSYEFRIYSVRNNIIELFSNLAEIGSAIERDNDALLNKYNEIVIDLVSNYN